MSYAPESYLEAREFLLGEFGLVGNEVGIVGDANHTYGYHLGRDRIHGDDYSTRLDRDRRGLTNAASALDIDTFAKTYPNGYTATLSTLSVWIVGQCRLGAADALWIREVIYTPDGSTVLRYDRERGQVSAPVPGEGDESHLRHTHLSGYRDTENADKAALFRRFVAEASGASPPEPGRPPAPAADFTKEIILALPTLQRGSTGTPVRRLQALCNVAGQHLTIDGDFGPLTEAAVKAEQAQAGIDVDGVVGRHTWSVLIDGRDLFKEG